jgi:hypothetical protein
MAQLRSDILCKRKREDTDNSEKRYKRMHIAEPIQEYQVDEEEEHDEFTFDAFNDSDTDEESEESDELEVSPADRNNINAFEDANNNILNSEQWTKLIDNWIEMVNAENTQNSNEQDTETYDDFEAGGHTIHPADNTLAKWKLLDLFNESLEEPVCIGSMINMN